MNFILEIDDLLTQAFQDNADEKSAVKMSAYMRDLFPFFGIKSPMRVELGKPIIAEIYKNKTVDIPELATHFWEKEQRDYQYFAMNVLAKYEKKLKEKDVTFIEYLVTNKSWWDTVDWVAAHLAGSYFKIYPHQIKDITGTWIESENKWLARTAILFQLNYKDKTDQTLLFNYCEKQAGHKDFFIQKAIGWALRNYFRIAPEAVQEFVETTPLANLSKREALKHL